MNVEEGGSKLSEMKQNKRTYYKMIVCLSKPESIENYELSVDNLQN